MTVVGKPARACLRLAGALDPAGRFVRAAWTAGRSSATRMAITAMTTIASTRVKPERAGQVRRVVRHDMIEDSSEVMTT